MTEQANRNILDRLADKVAAQRVTIQDLSETVEALEQENVLLRAKLERAEERYQDGTLAQCACRRDQDKGGGKR